MTAGAISPKGQPSRNFAAPLDGWHDNGGSVTAAYRARRLQELADVVRGIAGVARPGADAKSAMGEQAFSGKPFDLSCADFEHLGNFGGGHHYGDLNVCHVLGYRDPRGLAVLIRHVPYRRRFLTLMSQNVPQIA